MPNPHPIAGGVRHVRVHGSPDDLAAGDARARAAGPATPIDRGTPNFLTPNLLYLLTLT